MTRLVLLRLCFSLILLVLLALTLHVLIFIRFGIVVTFVLLSVGVLSGQEVIRVECVLVLRNLLLFNGLVLIDHVLIIRLRNHRRFTLVGNLLNGLGVFAMNDIGYGLMIVAVMGGLHLFIALLMNTVDWQIILGNLDSSRAALTCLASGGARILLTPLLLVE